jgi:hypothetical protein
MQLALVGAACGVLLLGFFPGVLLGVAERSASALLPVPSSLLGLGPDR